MLPKLQLHQDKRTNEYVLMNVYDDNNMCFRFEERCRFQNGDQCFRYLSHWYGDGIHIDLCCELVTEEYGTFNGHLLYPHKEFEKQKKKAEQTLRWTTKPGRWVRMVKKSYFWRWLTPEEEKEYD